MSPTGVLLKKIKVDALRRVIVRTTLITSARTRVKWVTDPVLTEGTNIY